MQCASGELRGRHPQSSRDVIGNRVPRLPAAHERARKVERCSGRGDVPDPAADDLRLRWQDEFEAILRRSSAVVDQNVLRPGADIDRQYPDCGTRRFGIDVLLMIVRMTVHVLPRSSSMRVLDRSTQASEATGMLTT